MDIISSWAIGLFFQPVLDDPGQMLFFIAPYLQCARVGEILPIWELFECLFISIWQNVGPALVIFIILGKFSFETIKLTSNGRF